MMDAETVRLAKEELNELRKKAYRGPHPQRHLFKYFDWMEKKVADDVATDMKAVDKLGELAATYELNNRLHNAMIAKHGGCIEDLWHRVRKIEIAISNKETA